MSDSNGLTGLFIWLVRAIWDEIKEFGNSRQRVAAKLNTAFGLVAAVVLLILAVPSLLEELAGVLRALRGQEVPGNDAWATIIGFISLLIYFIVCVLITSKEFGGTPPQSRHRGA